ncbi:hypothetical protein [Richelia intracellularis]|jgi:hypothetical protein|uniref:hypothetical protein n=1 Tax=Richelia intracellularis TaxID=1164990 RepID=UPI0005C7DA0D|nr:hypothetical protein [Richelia intracellularis]
MSLFTCNYFKDLELEVPCLSVTQPLLLQLGTISIITLLIAEKSAPAILVSLGAASEELFQGKQLPILKFPEIEKT